jgi:prepilin peptidase CpaA
MLIQAITLLLFPAMMAFAASSDLLTMTISNRITLTLLAGFFVLTMVSGMSQRELLSHVGAGFAVLVVTLVFFARGWIGGGDAKLAAVTALWFGFDQLLEYALYASLLGGVLTFAIIRFRLLPLPQVLARHAWLSRLHQLDSGVPYGIALAAAALLIYPETPWMKAVGF